MLGVEQSRHNLDMHHYGSSEGELLVFGSAPRWRGRIEGHRVEQAAALAGTDDAIVLLEPPPIDDLLRPFRNLLRVAADGTIVWRAELPVPADWTDQYVNFEQHAGILSANSWSCYFVVLDRETGDIVSKEFTK